MPNWKHIAVTIAIALAAIYIANNVPSVGKLVAPKPQT